MSKPYYPPCFVEDDIKKAEMSVDVLRPFPSTLPPIEWEKERDIQGFNAPMQGDTRQAGQKPDGSWFISKGTIFHHRQVQIRFTNHFRGLRHLTYLGSEKLVDDPLCHILFHPRAKDNLVITEMDEAMRTPRVEQALAAFELAKAGLREATERIEARCREIDPGYAGLILGFNASDRRQSAEKDALKQALFATREQVEDSYYEARNACQRELENAKKELRWARHDAWSPPPNNRDARNEYWEKIQGVLIRTLRNHGVYGFEQKGSQIINGMVQGLMAGTFALYELASQKQADDTADNLGLPMESKHRPLDIGLDPLLTAIRSENMNSVIKAGNGYFAYCVVSTHEGEKRQNEYQSTQGACLVGRVCGESGGWAMILPLFLWRAIILSVDSYLYHDLPKLVFGYTGHIWIKKQGDKEVICTRKRRVPPPQQNIQTEHPAAEEQPAGDDEFVSSDESEDSDEAEEPPPESDGETEDGPGGAEGGPVNGEGADAEPLEATAPS